MFKEHKKIKEKRFEKYKTARLNQMQNDFKSRVDRELGSMEADKENYYKKLRDLDND